MTCINQDAISIETLEWVLGWRFIERIDDCSLWIGENSKDISEDLYKNNYGNLLNVKFGLNNKPSIIFKKNSNNEFFYQTPQEYIYSGEGFLTVLKIMHNLNFSSSHSKLLYSGEWSWEFNHESGYHSKQVDEDFCSACYRSAIQAISVMGRVN